MRRMLGALVLAAALAACVNTPDGSTPEWADAEGYPSLREVPSGGTSATTDARHWRQVESELSAARAQVEASPRAQDSTQTEDPNAFLDDARREIEETRSSHNPY